MSDSAKQAESHEFRAEVRQLLDILIHSVYTAKDVFVRELLSNAADALEKIRFLKARGDAVHEPDTELEITIETGEEEGRKTLIIADSGIGMTEAEISDNLGTIAHSGATEFLRELEQNKDQQDPSLIGRFGVGFYSVFMVAEQVRVTSRGASSDASPVLWTSDGLGSYTVAPAPAETPRGTRVEIRLKEADEQFADLETVKATIRKYSNFIPFPVRVAGEQVNATQALWRELPHTVKEEEYAEFHKLLAHDFEDPLLHVHLAVDVPLQFYALLSVPKTNTEALGFGEGKVSLQLYVKRVLIDGESESLLPRYLRFVKGVVESEDLPLNVSRETLQENPLVAKIRDTLTRKLLKRFAELADKQPEEYAIFWRSFGRILKEGHSDFAHRDALHELVRFNSSHHDDAEGLCGLADYLGRMPEAQKAIYYLSGASREALESDPRLELFRKKGVEVLYLTDLADEFVLGNLGTYKEKPIVSADQVAAADLGELGDSAADADDEKAGDEDDGPGIDPLIVRFGEILGDRVSGIRRSERLVDSPACLVGEEGVSAHMDRMVRMMKRDSGLPKRVLELNPRHSLVKNLAGLCAADREDPFISKAAEQLFEGAMLADGYLVDPHKLVERMHDILDQAAELKRK